MSLNGFILYIFRKSDVSKESAPLNLVKLSGGKPLLGTSEKQSFTNCSSSSNESLAC